jgi:hypothetical protein
MKAMTYRGPYKVRIEEKDIPAIEHPNDAIVRVELAACMPRNSPCWDVKTWAPDSIRRDGASGARNLEGPQNEVSVARSLSKDPPGKHRACHQRRLPGHC